MSNLGDFNFNAEEHEDPSFDPIPAGTYTAIIATSEMKMTKNKDGQYLSLSFDIMEGKQQGRKFFENINLVNKNEKAVKIGKSVLAMLCRAVGVLQPKDSSELHNKVFKVELDCKKDGEGKMRNSIKKAFSMSAKVEEKASQKSDDTSEDVPF